MLHPCPRDAFCRHLTPHARAAQPSGKRADNERGDDETDGILSSSSPASPSSSSDDRPATVSILAKPSK